MTYELRSIMGVGVVLCSHLDQPGWEGGSCQGGEGKGEEDKEAREVLGGHLRLRLEARVAEGRWVVVITSVYGCKMRCLLASAPAPASFIAPRDVTALQS